MQLENQVLIELAKILRVKQEEVTFCQSTTMGLQEILGAMYKPEGKRNKMFMNKSEFFRYLSCLVSDNILNKDGMHGGHVAF